MKQYIIGSAPTADRGQVPIVVNEPHVSRTHCRVFFDSGQAYIEDLGSLNGTYVDEIRIQSPTPINEYSSVMLAGETPFNFFDYGLVKGSVHAKRNSVYAQGNTEYAPFGDRFIAYFVDNIIIGVPFFTFSYLMGILLWNIPLLALLLDLTATFLIIHFYFALPISQNGTTFGRKMFRVEYLDINTMEYPSVGKVWLRVIGYSISGLFFGVGFLLALFTEKRQALHDLIANTIVVKK